MKSQENKQDGTHEPECKHVLENKKKYTYIYISDAAVEVKKKVKDEQLFCSRSIRHWKKKPEEASTLPVDQKKDSPPGPSQ